MSSNVRASLSYLILIYYFVDHGPYLTGQSLGFLKINDNITPKTKDLVKTRLLLNDKHKKSIAVILQLTSLTIKL